MSASRTRQFFNWMWSNPFTVLHRMALMWCFLAVIVAVMLSAAFIVDAIERMCR